MHDPILLWIIVLVAFILFGFAWPHIRKYTAPDEAPLRDDSPGTSNSTCKPWVNPFV